MKANLYIFLFFFMGAQTLATADIDDKFYIENHPAHGAIKLWPHDGKMNAAPRRYKTPTKKVSDEKMPVFKDDIDFARMDIALKRQLKRYRRFNARGTIRFGSTKYPLKHVTKTLETFQTLSEETQECFRTDEFTREQCLKTMNAIIRERFDVYVPNLTADDPRHGEEHSTFFTSYYTPTLKASKTREGTFKHGIYKLPRSNSLRRSKFEQTYFEDRLEGKNLSLYYTENLFKLFLLHIQGGGKVVYEENGQEKSAYVHFAGTNSRPLRWLSKYMKEKGYIEDTSIVSQREFLKANPDKHREIFSYNESVVYYAEKKHPAEGSAGVSVTPGRSIATDWRKYGYKGLLTYIEAQRPTEESTEANVEYKPFSRFMLDQDTGGAIKGKGRVDIFHGEDPYAELAAFNTQHTGNLYYLMLKK